MTEFQRLTHEEVVELAAPFVLGALEADDEAAVREHLATCHLAHDEFLELGSVVASLAETVEPVEPPATLKGRILAAAAADLEARQAPDGQAAAATPAPERIDAPGISAPIELAPRRRRSPVLAWGLAAAAVIAIVALVGSNLFLLGRLGDSESYARDVAAVLDAGAQPGSLTAVLAPANPNGPRGLAAVSAEGTLTLAVQGLTQTSGSQVYEAWVIAGDTAPVPLGGFRVGASGTGRLDGVNLPVRPGIVLALTLEPAPGAQAPTLPILASGTALAPPAEGAGERPQGRVATVAP